MTDQLLVTPEDQQAFRSQQATDAAWLADLQRWTSENYRHQLAADASQRDGTPLPEDTRAYLDELEATREKNHAAMMVRVARRDEQLQEIRDRQQREDAVADMLGDELPSELRRRLNDEIDRRIASGRRVGAFLMRAN